MRVRLPAALAACLLLLALTRSATALPPNFSDSLVVEVPAPTAVAFTPDARMLIATQTGPLRLFDGTSLLPGPVLDLSQDVCNSEEDGLLGVAVDPSFTANDYIYVYYTHADRGACFNRVSRFTMSGNTASPASELVLVDDIPATGGYHNAGDLQFGKDGYLYVSVGDGGCDYAGDSGCGGANDASRDENALVGKILRITAEGGIPPTNPFQGPGTARCDTGTVSPGFKCQETYARGLRNPFRIAFDPNAGGTRFFVNDVGQNAWEEIDDGQAGADYGWNEREGPCANGSTTDCGPPPAGMTNPIFSYDHADGCSSITGGAFVPDGVWPGYDGAYVYGDYVCGKLFVLTQSGGSYSSTEFTTGAGSPVDMRFGPDGSTQALYYTNYVNGGQVRRIVYTGTANRAPTAAVSANPTAGAAPLTVSFDASASSDPDPGDTLTFRWDFGDGSPTVQTTAPTTSHTFISTGSFTASVVAIDDHGAASQPATVRIDPGDTPPQPSIDAPAPDYTFGVGETITLRGSATDAEDGPLPGSSLSWTVIRHHNTHTHPFLAPTTGASVNIVGPEPEDLAAAANSYLEIFLTATDSRGLSKTVSMNLQPAKVGITLGTNPAGLALEVNGFTAPSSFVSWKNWAFTVNAPDQTDTTGKRWTFTSWSDGGARSHTIVTPASPATYTATFAGAAPAGLVAAYGFDDGSGANAADSSGKGNTGAVSGAAWTPAGKYGSALSFNGTSSKVVVPDADSLDLTTALTLEAWVRPIALSAWRTIALKERSGGIVYSLYANDPGNRPVGQVDIGGQHNALGSGALPLDTWSHLAVTWDGTTLRLYVDGAQAGSTTVTGTLLDSTGPLDIGGNDVWGEYFSGLIDEVRVYNRALAASEIQTDMNQPVGAGAPPADSQPPTAPTSLQPSVSGNTVTLTWGAATDNVAVRRYHVHRATNAGFAPTAANEIATTNATSYADTALAPGTYFYKVTAEDTSGNVGPPSNEVAAAVSPPPPSGNGLVAAYGFDEGSGTSAADASGNGNTGTLSGGAAWSTSGHSGNALSFNGSTGRVAIADADSLDLTTALTLEAWVRPSALSDWRTVVLKERNGGIVYSLYANNSGDRPAGQVDVGGEQNAVGAAKLPLDTWSHLAVTWDGAMLRLYVDGVESGSKAVTGSLVDSSGPLDIGGNTVWGEHFAGLIDDVRVYNHALSASDVQADMAQPVGGGAPAADTQPPTAPANLRSTVNGSSVALAWDAASDNVGIRRYHVHQATSSGFTPSAANEIGTASTMTYTDTGLAAGTYYYKVTAEDTSGNVGPGSAETSASVESAPAATGLVAAYGFDEGSGTATADASGNGNSGALAGGVSWTTSGHTGSALAFDGVDALVTVADARSLELAGPLTLEAWVRPATVNASYRTVVLKERSGGLSYALYADTSAGGPSGHVYVEGSEPRARAAIPLAANTWTHLAMTYDLTTIRLYVNGSFAASTATTGSVTTSTGPLRIGGNTVWGEDFGGVIDDVRVYNRALSAVEIGADMSRPV